MSIYILIILCIYTAIGFAALIATIADPFGEINHWTTYVFLFMVLSGVIAIIFQAKLM